jgi:hypothetical protein
MRPRTWLLALIGTWVAAIVLIWPAGNFPLIDDWIYAYGVQALVTRGTFQVSPYMEATGVAQVLWGALFASIGGVTFDVLRLSTLALVPVGMAAIWKTTMELGGSPAAATAAAATFALNPVALTLAPTFMTDLPFSACTAMACLFFFRALARPRWSTVCAATALATLAVFVRQQGLAWPAAFAVAALFAFPRSWRGRAMALTPLVVAAAAFVAYYVWLKSSGRRPSETDVRVGELAVLWARGLGQDWMAFPKTALNIGFHWGWYALPFVIWTTRAAAPRVRTGLAILCAAAAAVLVTGKIAPWGSAVLYDIGIGPVMLQGIPGPQEVASVPHAPRWVWGMWTIAAAWGAAIMLARVAGELARRVRSGDEQDAARRARIVFAVSGLLIFAAPMILVGFYDRYLLATLPITFGLCVLVAGTTGTMIARAAASVLLCMYAVFGIAAAHDYFALNRARWEAIHSLLATGYRLEQVNGGVEYAGLHGLHATGHPLNMPQAIVVVTLDRLPDRVVCGSFPFRRWMPAREDRIWVLGRDAAACRAGS